MLSLRGRAGPQFSRIEELVEYFSRKAELSFDIAGESKSIFLNFTSECVVCVCVCYCVIVSLCLYHVIVSLCSYCAIVFWNDRNSVTFCFYSLFPLLSLSLSHYNHVYVCTTACGRV